MHIQDCFIRIILYRNIHVRKSQQTCCQICQRSLLLFVYAIYLLLFCRIILGVVLLCELYRCYALQSCFFYHIHCMSVKLSSFLCSLQCASRLWYVQCIPIEFCFSFILLVIKDSLYGINKTRLVLSLQLCVLWCLLPWSVNDKPCNLFKQQFKLAMFYAYPQLKIFPLWK